MRVGVDPVTPAQINALRAHCKKLVADHESGVAKCPAEGLEWARQFLANNPRDMVAGRDDDMPRLGVPA